MKRKPTIDLASGTKNPKKQNLIDYYIKRPGGQNIEEIVSRLAALDGFSFNSICRSEFIRESWSNRDLKSPKSPTSISDLTYKFYEQIKKATLTHLSKSLKTIKE